MFFRPGTTDLEVYHQIFIKKQFRYLYAIYQYRPPPKYILDAGANAGFSTLLFKLLWPDAVVVSVEPNPDTFEILRKNTAVFHHHLGVKLIEGGVWGWKTRIEANVDQQRITAPGQAWGYVFSALEDTAQSKSGATQQAYSVTDLATLLDIPAFDFLKFDIEGAEGMVFAPEADLSWMNNALLVSLEVHDFFHERYGLEENEISARIDAAFRGKSFLMATDNEHTWFVSDQLLERR